MSSEAPYFVLFCLLVIVLLALDLGVFHRKAHAIRLREALGWSAFWISLGLLFNLLLFFTGTPQTPDTSKAAMEFLTGFLIEKALSVDNIFVFAVMFSYFRVPAHLQHRVLFWGILGALVMRGFFIWAGIELINRFHWTIYILGGLLIVTGIKLLFAKDKAPNPERNPALKIFRRIFPVTSDFRGGHFFVRESGRWVATPLAVVLLLVETTDVVFAVDSIPAVIAVTRDPFIVFTSNVFAILGLRALYFALAGLIDLFHYLTFGLCAILVFVGTKMILSEYVKIPVTITLSVVGGVLLLSIVASLLVRPKVADPEPEAADSGNAT